MKEHKATSISAVVVSHNSGEDILRCLAALHAQTLPARQMIVVDNNSSDGSPLKIQRDFPNVQLIILKENSGPAVSRNIGIAQVISELALILDDDIFMESDTLEILERTIENERCDIVCPRILLFPETNYCQCDGTDSHFLGNMRLRNALKPVRDLPVTPSPVDGSIGACNLVRMNAIRHAGGYNELFFHYFEDHEFSLRMNAFGHRTYCQPTATVFHKKGKGTPGLSFRNKDKYPPRRAYHTIRNRWMTILITYQFRTIVLLIPALFLFEVGTFLRVISSGWLIQWLKAIKSIWQQMDQILENRSFIQKNRVLSDYHILSSGKLTFAPGFITSRFQTSLLKILSFLVNINWYMVIWLIK